MGSCLSCNASTNSSINFQNLIVTGYIEEVQSVLTQKYQNTDFNLFIIPSLIAQIILSYYDTIYQVYGIGQNLHLSRNDINGSYKSFKELYSFQHIFINENATYIGNDVLYIKDRSGNIYVNGINNYFLNKKSNNNPYFAKIDFNKFIDIENDKNVPIELMSNTYHNSVVVKLTNGAIYYSFKQNKLKKMKANLHIKKVDCGKDHLLLLSFGNKMYAFGSNTTGQCGDDKNDYYDYPKLVTRNSLNNPFNAIDICCGPDFSCCITPNSELYYFGHYLVPQYEWSQWLSSNTMIKCSDNCIKVSCGSNFFVFLEKTGRCSGKIMNSELYNNPRQTYKFCDFSVKDFVVGYNHIALIDFNNMIFMKGTSGNTGNKCGPRCCYNSYSHLYKLGFDVFPNLKYDAKLHKIILGMNNTIIVFK